MSDLLHWIEPWAEVWGANLWRATWQAAIVIPLAWAVVRFCRWLSPRVACWIWRLVCVKLLVALFWVQPVLIPVLPADPFVAATQPTGLPMATTVDPGPATPTAAKPAIAQPASIAYGTLLFAWLVGVCYRGVVTSGQWRRARDLCRMATPATDEALWSLLRLEAARLAVDRLPDLRLSRHVEGPLLAGIWRPTLVLPVDACEKFSEAELRLMLSHELAHLARRDLAWNWLPMIVGWLFFFHPLVWLLPRLWSESQEAACDELLLQTDVARPAEYGFLLLKLSTESPSQPRATLVTAGVLGNYRNLQRRILAMTRVKQRSLRQLLSAGAVLVLVAVLGIVPWRLVAQEVDPAQARAASIQNLKHMGLALYNFHDFQKSFPTPTIDDKNGTPLLSWRVALLPYFEFPECQELYKQFHLDERWDSPHNKPLVAKMPEVFRCPSSKKADSGMTVYLAPRGNATAFPGGLGVRLRDITDGTVTTIGIVEADDDHAVPWTKPDDWAFDPDNPARGLGGQQAGDVFLTLTCDGAVHALATNIDQDLLRALFTRNGGEVIESGELERAHAPK